MRRGWCERYGCHTLGSVVVWVTLGPAALGTIPVWSCRACARATAAGKVGAMPDHG
jgi:hypothetical protein